jgi:hypothetical protein
MWLLLTGPGLAMDICAADRSPVNGVSTSKPTNLRAALEARGGQRASQSAGRRWIRCPLARFQGRLALPAVCVTSRRAAGMREQGPLGKRHAVDRDLPKAVGGRRALQLTSRSWGSKAWAAPKCPRAAPRRPSRPPRWRPREHAVEWSSMGPPVGPPCAFGHARQRSGPPENALDTRGIDACGAPRASDFQSCALPTELSRRERRS